MPIRHRCVAWRLSRALPILGIGSFAGGQSIPAFPGADGAAGTVTGGRGGIVYHVTKTNSAIDDPARNDPGTIRYGLNNANFPAGPRTIVFDVGGVFNLGRLPQPNAANGPWDPNGNGWDAQSRLTIGGTNVTLAGQTAPGPGVIFMGGGLKPQGNNNIIRNITVASGYGLTGWWAPGNPHPGVPGAPGTTTDQTQWFPDNVVYDAMDIAGTNLMIDHVSTMYATDETISMNEVARNITVQYSNISQAQNYPQADAENMGNLTGHALGSLLSAGSTTAQAAISFHHNMYAHLKGRVPQLGTISGSQGAYYDFRNNVFYNWMGTAGSKGGTTFLNLVNNFYLAGNGGDNPVGGTSPNITTAAGGTGVLGASSTVHRSGNLLDSNKDGDANDGVLLSNSGGAANPLWLGGTATYTGMTDTATTAFDRVLNYMGANWWLRDGVINTPDERMINEARTGTGKIIAWADDPWNSDPTEGVEWRTLKDTPTVSRDASYDIDGDGMPGVWESDHGLDPAVADNNGDFDNDGYTNLEEFINEIAAWPAPTPINFTGATSNRYALTTNWAMSWQPSRYDTAVINSGSVVVDAVGQHARTLLVGQSGSATLALTAGWLRIEQLTRVFETGSIDFAGGKLDITRGAGIVDYSGASPLAAITAQIASGYNGGSWNGAGIMSVDAANTSGTAIGVGEAGELGITSFAGQMVDPTTVLFRYTRLGDANLNGTTEIGDFSLLAANFNTTGGWARGDFNYDGSVNIGDFSLLAANFNQSVGSALPRSAVPEPCALGIVVLIPAIEWRRRRRRG